MRTEELEFLVPHEIPLVRPPEHNRPGTLRLIFAEQIQYYMNNPRQPASVVLAIRASMRSFEFLADEMWAKSVDQ